MVEGKQLMVVWHVDNLKVSHHQESVVETFISQMEGEYSKETLSWGQVHNYLGMTLDFLELHCIVFWVRLCKDDAVRYTQ